MRIPFLAFLSFSLTPFIQQHSLSNLQNLSTAFLGKHGAVFVLLTPRCQSAVNLHFVQNQPSLLLVSWFFNDPEHGVKIKAIPSVLLWFDIVDPFQACPGLGFAFREAAHFDLPETNHFDYQKHAGFRNCEAQNQCYVIEETVIGLSKFKMTLLEGKKSRWYKRWDSALKCSFLLIFLYNMGPCLALMS